MPCPICSEPITDADFDTGNTFATTYYGVDDADFALLDDGVAHQRCVDSWTNRDRFVAYYNVNCRDELRVSRSGHVIYCSSPFRKLWWRVTGG